MTTYEDWISDWKEEYASWIPIFVVRVQTSVLDPLVVGQTFILTGSGSPEARIELQAYLKEGSLTSKAILWHEWCHANAYEMTGRRQGHGTVWKKARSRKPFLAFWDMLPGRFVCAYWRAKL